MERDGRRPQYQGDGLDQYSELEPTSDAAEDVQPGSRAGGEPDPELEVAPPDNDDELGQYEGSYDEPGITSDIGDEYGTGGGDVGIGGDVSPHGAMHDAAARASDVEEDDSLVGGSEITRQGMAERDEDLDLVSDDLALQGDDEAWPRQEELGEDDPRAGFDDADSPLTDVRGEDELDDAA
jgi:hypothetical protein